MSDRPENQAGDYGRGPDDEFGPAPKPEQIWPPPAPKPRSTDSTGESWVEGVGKIDGVIEEIKRINGTSASASGSAGAVDQGGGYGGSVRVRARSDEELSQLWSNVFYSVEQGAPKSIVVASARRGDGATQIATGLSIIGAETNEDLRVVLADFNLRNPDVADQLGISNDRGVSDVLAGRTTLEAAVRTVPVQNGRTLHVLPGGMASEQPLGLLKSRQVKALISRLKERYDYVILDVANANAHPDAQVLGSMVDGALIVVSAGDTPRETVAEVKKRLDLAGVRCLGMVLNQRNDPIPDVLYRMA